MILPTEMEERLKTEIQQYEEGKRMPYISSWERLAMEEGREQGLEQGTRNVIIRLLKRRIGDIGADNSTSIEQLSLSQLDKLTEALLDFSEAQDLTRWLNRHTRRRAAGKQTKRG
ncbi:MAG TPA: DUF4351 domain-containing protein [Blastocatellia bacterium]|nr:DUF4351 domain-containing protein [Blastocatellia bacterium]